MIERSLNRFVAHGTKIVAASIFVGLVFPDLAALARPVFPVAVFCLLTVAMARVNLTAATAYASRPALLISGMLWMSVATPILLAAAFWAFPPTPAIALAVIFWATAPTTVSSPAFSSLLGLNATLSLALLLVAMLTAPFVIPTLTEFLADAEIGVTTAGLIIRLGLLIGGATITAWAIRACLGARAVSLAGPGFDSLNVVFMALFAIAAMDGVADTMLERPLHMAGLFVLAASLSIGCLGLTTVLFWRAGRITAATFGFSNANRNMALVLGALAGNVPHDTWLFFAVAQFPIYLLPLLLKPVYARMLAQPAGPASPA